MGVVRRLVLSTEAVAILTVEVAERTVLSLDVFGAESLDASVDFVSKAPGEALAGAMKKRGGLVWFRNVPDGDGGLRRERFLFSQPEKLQLFIFGHLSALAFALASSS
jgi:hypothetical protein